MEEKEEGVEGREVRARIQGSGFRVSGLPGWHARM